jgi:glycosyltransferase involved in cell wall biosynthesis
LNKIAVIIPVLNEESSIGKVLDDIPKKVNEIIVVDNGSKR